MLPDSSRTTGLLALPAGISVVSSPATVVDQLAL